MNPQNQIPINRQSVPQSSDNINTSPAGHHPVDRIHLNMGQDSTDQGKNVSTIPQNWTPRSQTLAPQSSSQQVVTQQNLLDRYLLDYMKKKGYNKTAAIFAHQVVNQEPVVGHSLSDHWRMYYEEYGHLHERNEVQINTPTQTLMNQQLVTQGLGNMSISPAVQHRTHFNMGQQTTDKGKNVASDQQNLNPRSVMSAPQSWSQQSLNKLARNGRNNVWGLCSILRITPEQLFNPPIMVPVGQPSTNSLDKSSEHERQIGSSQFTDEAFLWNNGSEHRPSTDQLILKPKSNEAGNIAKVHADAEIVEISDDEIV